MSKTHRSFTLRVETPFYLELAEQAQNEKIPLNQLANRLLKLGLGKQGEVADGIRTLILDQMIPDAELREAVRQQVGA